MFLLSVSNIFVTEQQDTTNDQLADATMKPTEPISSPVFQQIRKVSELLTLNHNQHVYAPDSVAMQLLADVVDDQNEQLDNIECILMKVQEDVEQKSPSHEPVGCSSDLYLDENESPNKKPKQPQPEDVELQKSSKKHATSEMKFRAFEINWNKVSDNVLTKLNNIQEYKVKHQGKPIPTSLRLAKTDTTSLVNNIVDQLRVIDSEIKATVMETVSRQLLCKYPCLEFVDDDGCGNGMSYVIFKHKMINHNNYLNRFKDSSDQKPTSSNKGRHVKAGTLKVYWQNCEKHCTKEVLSKLRRDEPELLTSEFLTASQAFIRYRLNEAKELGKLLEEYPVFRRRGLLNYHFMQATGVNADNLRKYYCKKRSKIISFSSIAGRNIPKLSDECCDMDVFRILSCLVGENINNLIVKKEVVMHDQL